MIKKHVLFIFLLAVHLVELPKLHATEVMWDYSKDIIYYDGKLYYPDHNGEDSNINKDNQKSNENEEKEVETNENEMEEEELYTGGKFWFCIFMIFSNLKIIKVFYLFLI